MSDGTQILRITSEDIIPAEVHGFAVRLGIGPYPENQPRSHRRALYAELTPISIKAQAAMRYVGKTRILATTPLTPEAVADVQANPSSHLSERLAVETLTNASRLAQQAIGA